MQPLTDYRPGKQDASQSPQLMSKAGSFIKPFAKKAAIISSERAYNNEGQTLISSLKNAGIDTTWISFQGGESTWSEIKRLAVLVSNNECDAVISLGGGKTIDTGKAVAYLTNCSSIVVPTLASNDAPCSALSVIYREDHSVEEVFFYPLNPVAVLVDTLVIASAPVRYFIAGMGDAAATYYEGRTAFQNVKSRNCVGGRPTQSGLALAKLSIDLLLANGKTAVDEIKSGKFQSPAIEKVVEANTLLSGLGFESCGLAMAHGLHNGLTRVTATHDFLHGEKVAFCLLVHLVLEKEFEEAKQVAKFNRDVGLPRTLREIGMDVNETQTLLEAAQGGLEDELSKNMSCELSVDIIVAAIKEANRIGESIN